MNKTALITGSSRGIGRATAIKLAQSGYNVCINYIERDDLANALAKDLCEKGFNAMTFQADVSDKAGVKAMVKEVENKFGNIKKKSTD